MYLRLRPSINLSMDDEALNFYKQYLYISCTLYIGISMVHLAAE